MHLPNETSSVPSGDRRYEPSQLTARENVSRLSDPKVNVLAPSVQVPTRSPSEAAFDWSSLVAQNTRPVGVVAIRFDC